jgi:hypothetical protein
MEIRMSLLRLAKPGGRIGCIGLLGEGATLVVAAVLLRSALFHLGNGYAFLSTIHAYRLSPAWLGTLAAGFLPVFQLTLGMALLFFPAHCRAALGYSSGLFLAFTFVQSITYLRGLDIACGCFGSLAESPIGPRSIAFAGTCLAVSVLAMASGRD